MNRTVSKLTPHDFEMIAEMIPHIVWLSSGDGHTEYFNQRGADYTGLQPEDAESGWDWLKLLHPDDVERAALEWVSGLASGDPQELEYRIRRHDGEFRWMNIRCMPVRGQDDDILRWIGTCTDIDDQKRTATRHAELLSLLETLQSSAPIGFGLVDREYRFQIVNERLAAINGPSVEDHMGRTVAEVIPHLWPQLEPIYERIISTGSPVLDIDISGSTQSEPDITRYWLVNLYPVRVGQKIIGIGVVVVDITERKEAERARMKLLHDVVTSIAATVEARDPYTSGHEHRVAAIAAEIAVEMGLDDDTVEGINLTASIHDIGKISIPAEILSRPGRLHPAEFELVKGHSLSGADIVRGIDFPWPVADMILQHHERFDGTGYPAGLKGEEISLGARIIAVADVLEAMSSHRPYRPSRGLHEALSELERGRGTLFDPKVVEVCLRLVSAGRLTVHMSEASQERA